MMVPDAVAGWHALASSRDASALDALLADEVVFQSPVVRTPQGRRAITSKYLTAAMQVLFNDSFRYTREWHSERDAVLEFVAEIDGIVVNGVDLIAWNAQGRISEFKVMIRPLKAIQLIHQKMAQALAGSGEGGA